MGSSLPFHPQLRWEEEYDTLLRLLSNYLVLCGAHYIHQLQE
jgi:hypothetical protein